MSSLPLKLLGLVLVSAFVLALPADAANSRKNKKAVTAETAGPQYRGTNLVRPGPLYFSGVYLGDDPDPNIRFQIMRVVATAIDRPPLFRSRLWSGLIFAV